MDNGDKWFFGTMITMFILIGFSFYLDHVEEMEKLKSPTNTTPKQLSSDCNNKEGEK